MTRTARRPASAVLAGVLAIGLVLTGCAAGQISQTADQVAAIDGANGTVGDIGVRDARFAQANGNGYQKGADAPLLMTISNNGLQGDTLIKVSTPATETVTISGTAKLPAQTLTTFAKDSDVTVTLKNLAVPIPYGHSVPVTFSFAQAGSLTLNLPTEVPAKRSGDRSRADILVPEPTPIWESGEAEHAGG